MHFRQLIHPFSMLVSWPVVSTGGRGVRPLPQKQGSIATPNVSVRGRRREPSRANQRGTQRADSTSRAFRRRSDNAGRASSGLRGFAATRRRLPRFRLPRCSQAQRRLPAPPADTVRSDAELVARPQSYSGPQSHQCATPLAFEMSPPRPTSSARPRRPRIAAGRRSGGRSAPAECRAWF